MRALNPSGTGWTASDILLSHSPFENALRLHQMRPVDHFTADRQYARVGLCLERGDDRFGVPNVVLRRREGGVDDRDLRRVDGKLAREAFAPRSLGLRLEPLLVL